MPNHHFISYSNNDATDFALQLCDALKAGPPSIPAWLDKRELHPGPDWDDQIVEAIRNCESMLFVMSRDSVSKGSVCKNEWSRAMKYKKPVIPILFHADAEIPFQLENRQYIDFTGEFGTALARLRNHMMWMKSTEGQLQALRDRLTDADRDLRRTGDAQQQIRIREDITSIKKQVEAKQRVVSDPEGEKKRVDESICAGIERERTPEKPSCGVAKTKFINPPPGVAPSYWQDRHQETKLVGEFLADGASRLMTVVGRAGIGKTAMVCRLLKSLENGRLPDDLGPMHVDGIVYLSERGSRKVSFGDLFADLCKLLPKDKAGELDALYREANIATPVKMKALLRVFPEGRVLVLLDNFEDKIDCLSQEINDAEIDETLQALLTSEHHGIKAVITTRIVPKALALVEPQLQRTIRLDEGLDSPYAENILREMDSDGKIGLKNASAALLTEARERTRGYPRALEALFAILSADRETSLPELLADAKNILPDHVVEKMVGEAFSRLDPDAKKVMQAMAIYGRPVSNVAIDYLLQPYMEGVDSAKVLNRLFNMQFVRKEKGLYYLHPVDREYALCAIQKGEPGDRRLDGEYIVFSHYALLHRGADYFAETRLPRENWKKLDDLAPQLAEYELRFCGEEYDEAARVLLEIDFNYLMLWGHYKLGAGLHERLQGRIEDKGLQGSCVGTLGTMYNQMGQSRQAIKCYEQALLYARERENLQNEGAWLGNLGICYSDLGETRRAIKYHEQALVIDQEIGDRKGESANLCNLGSCYSALGETRRAIEYHEQAMVIDREIGNRGGEGSDLGNLGNRYSELGETRRAIEYHEQALAIAREIGYLRNEGVSLGSIGLCYSELGETRRAIEYHEQALAIAKKIGDRSNVGTWLGWLGLAFSNLGVMQRAIEYTELSLQIAREVGDRGFEASEMDDLSKLFIDENRIKEACETLNHAIKISDEVEHNQTRNESRSSLALTHLYQNNLPAALATITDAQKFDYPPNNHNVHKLHGLILLHQNNHPAAAIAFSKSITESDALLAKSNHNYRALDSKALSLSGLALCNNDPELLAQSRQAFLDARAINSDAGYLKRQKRLFDKLAEKDATGMLERFWEEEVAA